MSQEVFHPYDEFILAACISNPGPEVYVNQPFVALLDVYQTYFWYPYWASEFDYVLTDVDIGMTTEELLNFVWPDEPSTGSGIKFYAALLRKDFTDLLGHMDIVEFGWAP